MRGRKPIEEFLADSYFRMGAVQRQFDFFFLIFSNDKETYRCVSLKFLKKLLESINIYFIDFF